jgi:CheY-like chemotaxis protein
MGAGRWKYYRAHSFHGIRATALAFEYQQRSDRRYGHRAHQRGIPSNDAGEGELVFLLALSPSARPVLVFGNRDSAQLRIGLRLSPTALNPRFEEASCHQITDGQTQQPCSETSTQAPIRSPSQLNLDVLVVDIPMPVLNGVDAVRQIRKSGSQARVVFLTEHEDPDIVPVCFEAGALGFVIKSLLASDLIPAIQSALAGQTFVSPAVPWEPDRTSLKRVG